MKLDILGFAAHPDDADIAYGGTLLKMALKGHKVGICDLTGGERGTRGTAETRKAELTRAAQILKLETRENLGIPDTKVVLSRENQIKVANAVRKFRPHVVILAPNDMRHPDHTHAERLCWEGCYFAGLKNFEAEGEPFRPHKVLRVHRLKDYSKPSIILDITDQIEQKIEAVLAFETQFPPPKPGEKTDRLFIADWIKKRAGYYGALIGKPYGEAFMHDEVMMVDDLTTLPVASM
jgi:bacillithiol biosynthesis deacetylase BshB1